MSTRLYLGGLAAAGAGYYAYKSLEKPQRQQLYVPEVVGDRQEQAMLDDNSIPTALMPEIAKGEFLGRRHGGVLSNQQVIKDKNAVYNERDEQIDKSISAVGDVADAAARGVEVTQKERLDSLAQAEKNRAKAISEYGKAVAAHDKLVKDSRNVDAMVLEKVENDLNFKRINLERADEVYDRLARDENFSDTAKKLEQQDEKMVNGKTSFMRWLTNKGIDDNGNSINEQRLKIDEATKNSLAGWGESASEFAKDKYDDAMDSIKSGLGPSQAQKNLNDLKKIKEKGWYTYSERPESQKMIADNTVKSLRGWGESAAQFADEQLEDLKSQYGNSLTIEDAKRNADIACNYLEDCKAEYVKAQKFKENSTSSIWSRMFSDEKSKTYQVQRIVEHDVAMYDLKQRLMKAEKNYDKAIEVLSKHLQSND